MNRFRTPKTWIVRSTALVAVAALVALGASSASSFAATPRAARPHAAHGTASVACAGSLVKLYKDSLGPAFKRVTGDTAGGPPCAGSLALASEILAHEINPGAFLAIGRHAIKELFPAKRAKFALSVASNPLVIAYSSKSRYYNQLNAVWTHSRPLSYLFTLFTTPGFRLGRTDPTQDPQGIFFILMTKLAQSVLHLPPGEAAKALGITSSSPFGYKSQQLDEDALPVDISEGVVDAGSEYLPEAKLYGLRYIALPPSLSFGAPSESKLYSTVSLKVSGSVQQGEVIYLNSALVSPQPGTTFSAADQAADVAFLTFMLRPAARTILKRVGYVLRPPVLVLAPGVKTAAQALPPLALKLFNALGGTIGS
jgi:molybdate/tungstate transport system substrate-binding protein